MPSSPAEVAQDGFVIATRARGFSEITAQVAAVVTASQVQVGIAQVFALHTSCSLLISENADPSVRGDLERWFAREVPTATRCSVTMRKVRTTCLRTSARSLPASA